LNPLRPHLHFQSRMDKFRFQLGIRPVFRLEDFPGFSQNDLMNLQRYYSTQRIRHLSPEKRVGWLTAESQKVRFEALASVEPLEGMKILDLGCGLGGLYGFLKERGIGVDYTGVDLFPPLIQEARKLNPGIRFETRVLLAQPYPSRNFDYVFLSGVFNVKVRDNWKYMRALLGAALRQCRRALAFNVLNAEADLREPDRFGANPRDLVSFCRRLGPSRVQLLDHYHPLDLTVFLYK
jgi:SAM-dependent methyltransferase